MNPIRNITIFFILIFSMFVFKFEVYASSSFMGLETSITPESNTEKIKSMQNLFMDLGLYNGDIDGNYDNIEGNLIEYQINAGLITTSSDWGAGYFGEKTMLMLQDEYGDKFDELAIKYLKIDTPELGERTFFVTAYYSPLPNQDRYSYNIYKKRYRTYQEEIRLQGDGKTTASGKKVFSGLIAAPKNYPFGTKIKLEGIGVGSVDDRGGAIVNAGERGHEYDRIDIWMGYGDEGLERAKKWGKREVSGEIVQANTLVSIEFDESPVARYSNLTLDADNPKKEDTENLQKLFSEVGLYDGEIDGDYNNIKNVLIDFQVDNQIIESKNSDEAGYFGKKTLAILREKYGGEIFKQIDNRVYLSLQKKKKLEKIKDLLLDFISNKSNGNKTKEEKYKLSLKISLEKYVNEIKNESKKQELNYLKSIL